MVVVCSYKNCKNQNSPKGISFFSFPTDEQRCIQWIEICGRDNLKNKDVNILHKYFKVCEEHFNPNFMIKIARGKYLLPHAIPVSSVDPPTSGMAHVELPNTKEEAHTTQDVEVALSSDESEFQCVNYDDVKVEIVEPNLKTEIKDMRNEIMKDPLDIGTKIKDSGSSSSEALSTSTTNRSSSAVHNQMQTKFSERSPREIVYIRKCTRPKKKMDKLLKTKSFKIEPNDSTSTERIESTNEIQMKIVKQETNTDLNPHEVYIKTEYQEDESEFQCSNSTYDMCLNYGDVKVEMNESYLKTEIVDMKNEIIQDPLDINSKVKVKAEEDYTSESHRKRKTMEPNEEKTEGENNRLKLTCVR